MVKPKARSLLRLLPKVESRALGKPKAESRRQNVQQLRLKELGRKACERLVRQVLGDTVGSDTMERLVKQADGNAFYLEELIRAVAEGKDAALPETVLAMVETRLAKLPSKARRVLRAASVFGAVCWDGAVATLLGEVPADRAFLASCAFIAGLLRPEPRVFEQRHGRLAQPPLYRDGDRQAAVVRFARSSARR